MALFNALDPYGLGVSMGVGGVDATVPSSYTPSFLIKSDPAKRRKLVASIVQWLEQHRGTSAQPAHTYDDVLAGVELDNIDQAARNELFKDLKANAKILAPDADHMQYRATHTGLFNSNDLAAYIAKFTHGIPQDELADAYKGVEDDIKFLLETRPAPIYSIAYIEKKRTILFPALEGFDMHVDQDLKDMWNAVQMPKSQVDLEERLHAAGHLSDTQYRAGHLEKSRQMQAAIKLAAGQKLISQAERRAKRKRYPQRLTNTHLAGQFEWFQVPGAKGPAGAAAAGAPGAASAAPK